MRARYGSSTAMIAIWSGSMSSIRPPNDSMWPKTSQFDANKSTKNITHFISLVFPTTCSGLFRNLFSLLGRHACRTRVAAHTPQRHGGGVLTVIRHLVLDLASSDSADHDGALIGVCGTLFAFWTTGHQVNSPE